MLKQLTFGFVSALALGAALPAANAADIYNRDRGSIKDTGPVDYLPAITWTGFYIGAHIGAAWDDSNHVQVIDDAAFLAGGHLGYNWQAPGNVVFGVEGDGDYLDGTDYLATIRGRLGYAFGPTLVYATGGAAFIGFSDNVNGNNNDTGWVAGGGIEHKIRDNVSVGLEGLYYGFDDNNNDNNGDNNFWAARARLTYHFNDRLSPLK